MKKTKRNRVKDQTWYPLARAAEEMVIHSKTLRRMARQAGVKPNAQGLWHIGELANLIIKGLPGARLRLLCEQVREKELANAATRRNTVSAIEVRRAIETVAASMKQFIAGHGQLEPEDKDKILVAIGDLEHRGLACLPEAEPMEDR